MATQILNSCPYFGISDDSFGVKSVFRFLFFCTAFTLIIEYANIRAYETTMIINCGMPVLISI